jgi:hypothetical protein
MWGAMKGNRTARLGLMVASLTAAALATAAQAQEGVLVKDLLGAIGIINEDKEAIDYRERAPLVLPPRMDLREPAAPGSVQARNPQWPNDPDIIARKNQAAEDSLPVTETDRYRMNSKNSRLTVDEMRAGRVAGASLPTTPQSRTERSWIHPDILRAQHAQHRNSSTSQVADDTRRRSLTDPPSAYRKPVSGEPIKSTWEPRVQENEADPKVFIRQQELRRQ